MSYRLSLLDKALIPQDVSSHRSLANTVRLARRADELGYYRYWFAEHHGAAVFGSSAPEVLAAYVLAQTRRIRVGTGGVMLQHYAPYKVAETFNLLATLAPGRVDLGVGRAPGGMPQTTHALKGGASSAVAPDFAAKLRDLDAFVTGAIPEGHDHAGLIAAPVPSSPPERILLGASVESAETAAALGWTYCYAGHFDGDPDRIARVFEAYRSRTGRMPLLAVVAFAGRSDEEARQVVSGFRLYRVRLSTGQTVNLANLEGAAEFARQSGADSYDAEEIVPHVIAGSASTVRAELDRLHEVFGVEEFVIDAPVTAFEHRLQSIETLADGVFAAVEALVPEVVPA